MNANPLSSASVSPVLPRACSTGIVVLVFVALALLAPPEGLGGLIHAEAAVTGGAAAAQAQGGSPLASQTLGRGYWHVFIAYAVAWLLILAWVISIARRLSKVEREIEE